MDTALWIVYRTLSILLYAFDFLLLVRAVCSWIPDFRNSKVYNLSYMITEPLLLPIRKLMWKFDWARRCPIDLSFIVLVLITRALDKLLVWLFIFLINVI